MKNMYGHEAIRILENEGTLFVFDIDICVNGIEAVSESLEETVRLSTTPKGNERIKITFRDISGGGRSGNVSKHGPAVKVRTVGGSVDVFLVNENGRKIVRIDRNATKLSRQIRKQLEDEVVPFVYKNYDLIIRLWYVDESNSDEINRIVDEFVSNNQDYKFKINRI